MISNHGSDNYTSDTEDLYFISNLVAGQVLSLRLHMTAGSQAEMILFDSLSGYNQNFDFLMFVDARHSQQRARSPGAFPNPAGTTFDFVNTQTSGTTASQDLIARWTVPAGWTSAIVSVVTNLTVTPLLAGILATDPTAYTIAISVAKPEAGGTSVGNVAY